MTHHPSIVLVLGALLVVPALAHAGAPGVPAGTPVLVTGTFDVHSDIYTDTGCGDPNCAGYVDMQIQHGADSAREGSSEDSATAQRDSTLRIEPQPHQTHRLKDGAIGALVGVAVGAGAGVLLARGCYDACCCYYVLTVPAGLLIGTIVGVVIGGRGDGEWRMSSSDALDPGRPRPVRAPLRIAVTVSF